MDIATSPEGKTAAEPRKRLRDRLFETPRRLRDRLREKSGYSKVFGHYVRLDLLKVESPAVVDAGANRGNFLSQLALPLGAKLLAIEPNSALRPDLLKVAGVRAISAGLSAQRGTRRFHLSDNSEASSMTEAFTSQSGIVGSTEIEVIDLEQAFAQLGVERIDLLKLDIEGEEIPVLLEAREQTLARIAQITVEFHVFLGGMEELRRAREVVRRLRGIGFISLNAPRSGTDFSNVLFLNRDHCRSTTYSRFFLSVLDPALSVICEAIDLLRGRIHAMRSRGSSAEER